MTPCWGVNVAFKSLARPPALCQASFTVPTKCSRMTDQVIESHLLTTLTQGRYAAIYSQVLPCKLYNLLLQQRQELLLESIFNLFSTFLRRNNLRNFWNNYSIQLLVYEQKCHGQHFWFAFQTSDLNKILPLYISANPGYVKFVHVIPTFLQ